MIEVVAIADMHGHLPVIPPCDVLLIAGDICPGGRAPLQSLWLRTTFCKWLDSIPAKEVVAVAGNHDWVFEKAPYSVIEMRWHYLRDSGVELFGLKIWGTPWQPRFFDWAFNLDEPDLAKRWALIPDDTDILVSHGPPHGIGDVTDRGESVGSPSLLNRILEVRPMLTVFGHIHEARGQHRCNEITLANVSIVNEKYENVYEPMTFQLSDVLVEV